MLPEAAAVSTAAEAAHDPRQQPLRFSLRLNNDLTPVQYVALADAAETAGFDQFWVSHDLFLRSSPVLLTAVALATRRIEIGTCIVNPYTQHPAELAMLAMTLDEVSGGRFNLGLGAGAGEFLKWVRLPQDRPLAQTRQALLQLRAALDGTPAPGWEDEAYLRFADAHAAATGGRRIPIYLAAMSPRMLHLAGELADGVLPLLFPPEHYANVAPLVDAGREAAGRPPEAVDLAACIWCSIGDDREQAEEELKEKIAYYGHALSPLLYERLGVTADEFRPIEHAIMTERDVVKARSLVIPQMLRIGIAGNTDDLIARLDGLVALGVRHLSFGPPLGPDPQAAIEAIGRDVIPRYRSGGAIGA